jgi:hypothetical protein
MDSSERNKTIDEAYVTGAKLFAVTVVLAVAVLTARAPDEDFPGTRLAGAVPAGAAGDAVPSPLRDELPPMRVVAPDRIESAPAPAFVGG